MGLNPSEPSGKRKGEEDERFRRYEGTRKRVQGLTFRMNVPRTLIEQPEPEASFSDAEEQETGVMVYKPSLFLVTITL